MTTGIPRLLGAYLFIACGAATGFAQPLANPQGEVKVLQVDVRGSQYLQKDTLLYYVSTKPGDRYDEKRLREDFRRLWATGFLENLTIDVRDAPGPSKIVIFAVSERKRIQVVDYRGSKQLKTTEIEDELKKREAQIRLDSFFDLAKVRRVEAILKEMLHKAGMHFATVRFDTKPIGGAGLQLSFVIDDGSKTKIKAINFEGNEVFTDARLRGQMKAIKQGGFFNLSWIGGKRTFTDAKWAGDADKPRGDRGRIEDFYLRSGFVTAQVGEPKLTYTDAHRGAPSKKPVKFVQVDIPVSEGLRYRVGEIKFDGLKVLKEPFARSLFKIQTGDYYDEAKIKKGFDKLRDIYGSIGYFQWTGAPRRKPDPERKVVDVTLAMEEDKQYFVGDIKFAGNDTTRDKVIRRELFMSEGDVFSTEALKGSIRRLNQLGYFKPLEGAPDLTPNPKMDNRIDVGFTLEEQNRNQFMVGASYNGAWGLGFNASFSTANFLGGGETFTLAVDYGKYQQNYRLGVTEPYFLDRPITAGFDIFRQKQIYRSWSYGNLPFEQSTNGLSLVTGRPIGRFGRFYLNYTYRDVHIGPPPADMDLSTLYAYDYTQGYALPSGAALGQVPEYSYRESRVTPTVSWNTVDNPTTPRRGFKLQALLPVSGGILGGSVDYIKPSLETTAYLPVGKKMALGLRAQTGVIWTYGNTTVLPYQQADFRYYLGGEFEVRGYYNRTIGPRSSATGRTLGGDSMVLFNAEYYIDILGPVRLLWFYDAGQAFMRDEPMSLSDLRTSTGAEARMMMPVVNLPMRFFYYWNPTPRYPGIPRNGYKFTIGTTF